MGRFMDKIKKLLSKLFMIIAIILVALAVIYMGGQGLELYGLTFSPTMLGLMAAIAVGIAYLCDRDQAARMVNIVSSGAKNLVDATSTVLGQAVTASGQIATTAISSWALPVGLCIGGYLLISNIGNKNDN